MHTNSKRDAWVDFFVLGLEYAVPDEDGFHPAISEFRLDPQWEHGLHQTPPDQALMLKESELCYETHLQNYAKRERDDEVNRQALEHWDSKCRNEYIAAEREAEERHRQQQKIERQATERRKAQLSKPERLRLKKILRYSDLVLRSVMADCERKPYIFPNYRIYDLSPIEAQELCLKYGALGRTAYAKAKPATPLHPQ